MIRKNVDSEAITRRSDEKNIHKGKKMSTLGENKNSFIDKRLQNEMKTKPLHLKLERK